MPNTVIAIRQSGETGNTPSLGVLANGELAINYADGILYYKTSANSLGSILTATPGGLDTEVQFNDGGSFGGDSGFTYNKTTETITTTNVESTLVNTSTLVASVATIPSISGDVVITGNIVPNADDTHFLGNTSFTFAAGHFDDLYVDGTVYVRAAVDLADEDRISFGTSQDVKLYYDGTLNQMNVELQGDSTMLKITDNNTDRFVFYKANGDFHATGNVNATNFFDDGLNVTGHAEAAFSKANSANVLAQSAFDKANQTAQIAFTTVAANGTNLVADANNDTLTITADTANGIQILADASSDTLDIGLKPSGVTAGVYGNNSTSVTITIDQFGRITSVSQTAITVTETDPLALAFAIALG